MGETTSWQDSVPQRKILAVQLATALYSLSRFFVEAPTGDIMQRFTDPDMAQTWPIRDDATLAAIEQIAQANELSFILNEDYLSMFGPKGSLHMAESEYTGADALPLVQSLNRQYREAGYSPQKTEGYPRDHFAVELGFLGHLTVKAGGDENFDEQIREFRAQHLDRYADILLQRVENTTTTQTYRGVVAMTRSALARLEEMTKVRE